MGSDSNAVSAASEPAARAAPKPLLSVPDGIFLTVGMVIGVGIFKLPSLVAGNTAGAAEFLSAWLLGGLVSLCGALVYAELASRHPETGGEYVFLMRGMGRGAAFLFAWSRMTVIQTGAIAAVAFAFGDYASEILRLGEKSSAVWAAIGVAAATALNLVGTPQSKTLQKIMLIGLIGALLLLSLAGLLSTGAAKPVAPGGTGTSFGLAMIFVLFTYGGWNEAAYLGGEVRDARRNMMRILVWGIVTVTVVYVLINASFLTALGLGGMRDSKAVAADVMRRVAGDRGAVLLALVVCVAALTTLNAAVFTGARTNWALGRDFALFRAVGAWRESGSTPANALLLQGAIALALVYVGSLTADGFSAMVAYTAPVFWTFFYLTGCTLFVFRERGGEEPAFRTPFHPHLLIAFCVMCLYMLWSSIDYIRNPEFGPKFGDMVLAGIAIMAAGIPLYWLARKK
ncbi:MAG: APC family permease [Betaproteobacteria bacterium]|nr:APC family permease [Betaproteobacteria bacterium]